MGYDVNYSTQILDKLGTIPMFEPSIGYGRVLAHHLFNRYKSAVKLSLADSFISRELGPNELASSRSTMEFAKRDLFAYPQYRTVLCALYLCRVPESVCACFVL